MADSPRRDGSGVVRLTLYSNGTQVADSVKIISVTVDKSINRVPAARITVLDGDMPQRDFPVSNSDAFKPGREIRIATGYDNQEQTIFQGIVTRQGIRISGDNYSRLEVECRDKAVAMTIGRRNATYVDSRDSDIISTLIGSYKGLSADVTTTATQHRELVQYYCSDWDFMLSRAEVNGMLVMADDGTVSVKAPQVDAPPLLTVGYGQDLIDFSADLDATSQLTSVTSVCWDMKQQAVAEEKAEPATLNQQGDLDSKVLAKVAGPASFRLQTSATLEQSSLKEWAAGQQLKAGLARIRGRMKFQGSATARIGGTIKLEGVGNRFNGTLFVSGVRHDIREGNWTTEVEFGMSREWFAERRDLVAPPASGLTPGIEGLHIGVVKKLDQDPGGEQRVQVSIPVLQAETDGVWARLAKFHASNGIGAFFIPEIGDEVVLGYVNNDPSHPVILGSLYSSSRPPPHELTADNFTKAIVTRSKLRVEFDDDKKEITILTPAGNTIVLSDNDKKILVQDQTGNRVELGTGGITLDSPKDIGISAKGKISIDAVGAIDISSKADVKVTGLNISNNANVGFTAKGSASAELSASGQTTVKGAMVMIN